MVVAFAKSLLVLETGKKKLFIQNSYCLDKNYGSVFRYRGKCFFGFFWHFSLILFFLPFPLPFSKKKKEEEINPENK